MIADDPTRRDDAALDWVRRIADPDFAAWEEHRAWLEQDPRNAAAFDAAALLIDDATAGLAPFAATAEPGWAANDNPPPADGGQPYRWRMIATAAAVAGIAAGLFALTSGSGPAPAARSRITIATAPAEMRTLHLADGTSVALNGDSAVSWARGTQREVRLERGEAFFDVMPRADRRFRVLAGNGVIEDLATAFDVVRDDAAVEVAVREGAIRYQSGAGQVRVGQGEVLHAEDGSATVRRIEASAAGSWRIGRLIYHDAPFPTIARDLERRVGVPVTVDADMVTRRFTGVIVLDPSSALLFRRVGTLLGVSATRDGIGWRLSGTQE